MDRQLARLSSAAPTTGLADLLPSSFYDFLAIDAFSSDAIPVHLLTRECFRTYRRLLKEDGVLALHISNRYFGLGPVVRGQAAPGKKAIRIYSDGNEFQGTDDAEWVLVTKNQYFLNTQEVQDCATPWSKSDQSPVVWTDDYSNLFHLFRQREN